MSKRLKWFISRVGKASLLFDLIIVMQSSIFSFMRMESYKSDHWLIQLILLLRIFDKIIFNLLINLLSFFEVFIVIHLGSSFFDLFNHFFVSISNFNASYLGTSNSMLGLVHGAFGVFIKLLFKLLSNKITDMRIFLRIFFLLLLEGFKPRALTKIIGEVDSYCVVSNCACHHIISFRFNLPIHLSIGHFFIIHWADEETN